MYKMAMSGLVLVYVLFLVCFLYIKGNEEKIGEEKAAYESTLDEVYRADNAAMEMGIISAASSGQRIVDYQTLDKEYKYDLTDRDMEALLRIVEAEAGGEDQEGKLLVANVVLNRVESEDFPDTVYDVVFQRSRGVTQFSPVKNGRYWTVEVSDDTIRAVERALAGEDISCGALYFAARKHADSKRMKWFDEKLTYLFAHGGHEFFTEPN